MEMSGGSTLPSTWKIILNEASCELKVFGIMMTRNKMTTAKKKVTCNTIQRRNSNCVHQGGGLIIQPCHSVDLHP